MDPNDFISLELTVKRLSPCGRGVAFFENSDKKIEVLGVLPGEKIAVEVRKKRRRSRVTSGKLLAILEASSHRVTAPCSHFGKCGGCVLQQMDYSEQVKYKENKVKALFPHTDPTLFYPLMRADPLYGYRNKMEFSFSQNLQGEKFLGLMQGAGKGRVETIQRCHLCSLWASHLLQKIRQWWEASNLQAYYMPKNAGHLITLTVREGMRTNAKLVMLTVSGNPEFALKKEELDSYKRAVLEALPNEKQLSIYLQIKQMGRGISTQFFEMHLAGPDTLSEELHLTTYNEKKVIKLKVNPSSFLQPNTYQAERFYAKAIELLELQGDELLLDLYCGIASIGLSLASHVKRVVAIEINPYAVHDAKENIKLNNQTNIEVHLGDVGKVLKELALAQPDVVVIDPPRAGLDALACEQLLQLGPEKICYISCNPETQSRDIALLTGYQIKAIQPVDQFPHTIHMENIVILHKVY